MIALDRRVSDLMHREVVTLQHDETLDLADDIMRLGRIRHLPVLEGERLVGVLSSRDLLAASLSKALEFEPLQRRAFLRAVEAKEVMTADVETATPGDSALDAGRRMLRRKIGCLLVVDEDGSFLGLLTETDLLRAALGEPREVEEIVVEAERDRFDEELEELRRVRDELRVQVHLGKAEARDLWAKLEHRFADAEAQLRSKARRAEEPLQDVGEAARLLLDEIRNGYRRLRELL
jgi:CBS domain-containing protein